MNTDPTEKDRIERIIEQKTLRPRIARVTDVEPHTSPDDFTNHRVDVETPPGNPIQSYQDVSVGQPGDGTIHVPEVDQLVVIDFFKGNGEEPYVVKSVYGTADRHRAPMGNPGVIRYKRGDKYFEMHPDGDWVRLAQKSGDMSAPDTVVEINDNGISIGGNGDGAIVDITANTTKDADGHVTDVTLDITRSSEVDIE